jgi:hypothetical protein
VEPADHGAFVDAAQVESIRVRTASYPAEYRRKLGDVIEVTSDARLAAWHRIGCRSEIEVKETRERLRKMNDEDLRVVWSRLCCRMVNGLGISSVD